MAADHGLTVEAEAIFAAPTDDQWTPLREQIGHVLHVDPETLHPDKVRRADA